MAVGQAAAGETRAVAGRWRSACFFTSIRAGKLTICCRAGLDRSAASSSQANALRWFVKVGGHKAVGGTVLGLDRKTTVELPRACPQPSPAAVARCCPRNACPRGSHAAVRGCR